ncbi:MAG: hypothetical protein V4669_15830 [Pseudomonadota bacterium]
MKAVKLAVVALGMGTQIAHGNISVAPELAPQDRPLTFTQPPQHRGHEQTLDLRPQLLPISETEDNTTATNQAPATQTPVWLYPSAVVGPAFVVVCCGVLRRQCARQEGQAGQLALDRLAAENAAAESA